jgi:glutathione S-transferase
MSPTITAFAASPDRGKGLARDMRVRWALEELGLPYDVRLVTFAEMKQPAHRAIHPFGQIPTFEDGELVLFESGSIILYLAEQHGQLLPADPLARAKIITWMFASVSTVEPPILEFQNARLLEADKPWTAERMPGVIDRVRVRLTELSNTLGDREWLAGDFSAADLMMVHVLLRLAPSGLLDDYPTLVAYTARAQARPAYQRAFAAQFAVYTASQAS